MPLKAQDWLSHGLHTRCAAVLFLAAWFLYFAGNGLWAPFSGDDLMNLHHYLSKPAHTLALDNLRYWSTSYRPLGGLFYSALYWLSGFDPFPFRAVCFALLGINLILLFRFCRLLSGSKETALFATFLAAYHAWFVDLYYSSGTVYDLLCFAFYFGAFTYYLRIRQADRLPNWKESIVLGVLYICALNAKEMAVTLPLFVAIYEWLYHTPRTAGSALKWPLFGGRMAVAGGLLTIPYVLGKLTGAGSLTENPAYQLSTSPGRFLDTFHLYLNPLLYQNHVFRDSNTVQLLLGMLALALWSRSRTLVFAWSFLLLSLLPVAFINHHAAFFLYIPFAGWVLYAAEILAALRRWLSDTLVRWFRFARGRYSEVFGICALLAILAWVLAPLHTHESVETLRLFQSVQPPSRTAAAGLLRLRPSVKRGARLLFVNDPFPKDQYFPVFLARLVYHDMSIDVTRTAVRPVPESEYRRYDVIFVYRGGAAPVAILKSG